MAYFAGVPVERQRLMLKGSLVKDGAAWADLAVLENQPLPAEVPPTPVDVVAFQRPPKLPEEAAQQLRWPERPAGRILRPRRRVVLLLLVVYCVMCPSGDRGTF